MVVLLFAAWLRLIALPELPVGLHYDEAANLILTRQIVEEGYRPLFIRAYTGKEVLFFYAAVPWVWMTGGEPWGLRLTAAMLGLLTVAATFAAVRALTQPRSGATSIALFAAAWMAVSVPHLILSRYGFRAIAQPLLQALTVAALWRGLRTGKRRWLALGGLFLGLTGYTYLAARLFPLPFVLALGWLLFRTTPAERPLRLRQLALVLVIAAATFAPLGGYFLRHPAAFTTRIAQVAAPTWQEAWRGLGLCLRAIFWPDAGDAYVRFNVPGRPMMTGLSAALALLGAGLIGVSPRRDAAEGAARVLALSSVILLVLPSALATGEITPSNLRMVGVFPFLSILPAWGLHGLLTCLPNRRVQWGIVMCLFLAGVLTSTTTYRAWASSDALFEAADGEMALAAQMLDLYAADPSETTVYIASEHYRHPTVAALAAHYDRAKWLTGGATLVLPAQGGAVYLVPESLPPPTPWPAAVTTRWETVRQPGLSDRTALERHHLSAADVAELRRRLLDSPAWMRPAPAGEAVAGTGSANFAQVVRLHAALMPRPCRVAEPCPLLIAWEPLASYSALQPVVRLLHPQTGEWARTMAFHYPPEEWTPGELVLDQLVVTPPMGTPPGQGYQIGVAFYDPSRDAALPRLVAERFAGLESRFPATAEGLQLAPMAQPPAPGDVAAACRRISQERPVAWMGLDLLGWRLTPDSTLLPGETLKLHLCWQALEAAPPFETVSLVLRGPVEATLFAGSPAGGYAFDSWRLGELIEDVYPLRLPRTLPAGAYTLQLQLDTSVAHDLLVLDVQSVMRRFEAPDIEQSQDVDFAGPGGEQIRLLGYALREAGSPELQQVTLYWQALATMEEDYFVFLHLREAASGTLVAQVDAMPQSGAYPTSLWMRGEVVTDVHILRWPVPDSSDPLASGYELSVGLYLQESGTHLMVDGERAWRLTDLAAAP